MDLSAEIVALIDEGRIARSRHEVIRRLADCLREPAALQTEILIRSAAGRAVGDRVLLEKLWAHIRKLEPERQGEYRMLVALLHPDGSIDWELGEYLIAWAEEARMTATQIASAFGADLLDSEE